MFRKFAGNLVKLKGILITCGAKIYPKVPNIAPPSRKPAAKSLPPPLLLLLHISKQNNIIERYKQNYKKST